MIFDATRPLVFNAIPDLGTARPDFLDRALIVEFLGIAPEMRRDEAQFWREFSERRPRVLGALLDAAVAGLRGLSQVKLDQPPRLADFALATMCRADAWSPWSVLRGLGKRRELLPVAVSNPSK